MKKFLLRSLILITIVLGISLLSKASANPASIDSSFSVKSPIGFNGAVKIIKTQTNGKTLVGGAFTTYKGVTAKFIVRLNADGTRDSSFNVGDTINAEVYAIAIQTDGKIIVGGNFYSYNSTGAKMLIRLNTDGSKDTGFIYTGDGPNSPVLAIAVQSDGKIILGGKFTSFNVPITPVCSDPQYTTETSCYGSCSNPQYIDQISCENVGVCSDPQYTNQTSCQNNGSCSDPQYTDQISCESVYGCIDRNTGLQLSQYTGQTSCESAISCSDPQYTDQTTCEALRCDNPQYTDQTTCENNGQYRGQLYGWGPNYGWVPINGRQTNNWTKSYTRTNHGNRWNTQTTTTANRIIRLNSDGSRDDTFTMGGGFNYDVNDIAIQNDGKILVGGPFSSYSGTLVNYIVRLNADGTIDTGFTIGTKLTNRSFLGISDISIQNDGKIILVGDFTMYIGTATNRIIRLNTDGTKDTSFNIGSGFNNDVLSVATQSDGKIVIGGRFSSYSGTSVRYIVRLNTDGTRDSSFSTAYGLYGYYGYSVAIQTGGKILLGSEAGGFQGFYCLNNSGIKDSSFEMGDGFNASVTTAISQNDGKVLVGGGFTSYGGVTTNLITRFNVDGTKDTGFNAGGTGFVTTTNYTVNSMVMNSDEKIIVGGRFTVYNGVSANYILRLNTDGTRDTGFIIGGGFNLYVNTLAIQSDGKIIAGGSFTTYSGAASKYITRLNTDGSKDTGFIIGSSFDVAPATIAVQSDGKIIVGGYFTTYSGTAVNKIVRLNTDGTIDSGFTIGSGFGGGDVYILAVQDDGKILVGGFFTSYNGVTANKIIRLNSDGTRDVSFNEGGTGFNGAVKIITIQSNGKILVGGYAFSLYNGVTANKIIRLNSDGTRDTTFDIGVGFDGGVNTIITNSNNKIFIGGGFTTYNGLPAGGFISLYGDSNVVTLPNSTNTTTVNNEFTTKGYIQSNGNLVGSTAISLGTTDGNIPTSLSIQNQNIKLAIPANTQIKQADNVTNYNGIISAPMTQSINSVNDQAVVTAFKVGSSTESLKLTGGVATLTVPAPGKTVGDSMDIYYSEDNGVSWYLHTTTTVIDISGSPYVQFITNHFTDFAVTLPGGGSSNGTFTINNDAGSTSSASVTLNIAGNGITNMRFSDDNSTRSSWETFATTKAWTLPGTYGTKTVYAQFDTDNVTATVEGSSNDTISYSAGGGGGGNTTEGNISLKVNTGTSFCTIGGTGWNAGVGAASFSAFSVTGAINSNFSCTDYDGITSRNMQIIMNTNLTGTNGQTIPKTNVSMNAYTNKVTAGICTTGTNNNTWTNIGTTAATILQKNGNLGDICTITSTGVQLAITVPANQAVGVYTGTLTISTYW